MPIVSIHAPTRGATLRRLLLIGLICLSFNPRTHTGCDSFKITIYIVYFSFNPRTHTGCDAVFPLSVANCFSVSIHAPTRGATRCRRNSVPYFQFQSTHPHGVRRYKKQIAAQAATFQSTHPHGVRLCFLIQGGFRQVFCFNPRTHTGCDLIISMWLFLSCGFNPRTHTGCDTT